MSEDDDTIRQLLEATVERDTAPADARQQIEQRIGVREVILGIVELFTIVPATIVSEFLAGSGTAPTDTEDRT